MIKEFIDKWEKHKKELENYFRNTNQKEYDEYWKIVRKIVELILNADDEDYDKWDDGIQIIDDGDYQGTQIFVIHKDTYQPDIEEYVYTSNYYGSCSGCDTLLSISHYDDELPSENQINEYMLLSLHLIQNFRKFKGD